MRYVRCASSGPTVSHKGEKRFPTSLRFVFEPPRWPRQRHGLAVLSRQHDQVRSHIVVPVFGKGDRGHGHGSLPPSLRLGDVSGRASGIGGRSGIPPHFAFQTTVLGTLTARSSPDAVARVDEPLRAVLDL
jgi:hypothetical protein